ncbi:hypothetical protein HPB48_016759 [Haemaphysalis longicornis]|uniref:Uncharacterized protein n=1 Tax=Haemaphysalis longicornis TaxID=44386 RepID=A0A9J6FSH1_HAELO|nr:hypothetical protein HPB48_016759 [Haemaphysalis longicornis]
MVSHAPRIKRGTDLHSPVPVEMPHRCRWGIYVCVAPSAEVSAKQWPADFSPADSSLLLPLLAQWAADASTNRWSSCFSAAQQAAEIASVSVETSVERRSSRFSTRVASSLLVPISFSRPRFLRLLRPSRLRLASPAGRLSRR